jgi:O-antigen/teichoic acid export membrane protein
MSPPAPSADSLPSGRRRWWRVGQNAGALVAARVVSGLCQLALIPLLLGLLGTRTFGWVMALVALVGLSQFADLGAAMALQQKLSEAWARGDAAGLRRTYASGVRLLLDLGLAWFIFAAPAAWWLGSRLLAVPAGAPGHQSQLCWLLIAVATTAGVPLSAGPRLAAALQFGWIAAGWTAAANVGTLLALWLFARTGSAGLVPVVALLCLGQLLPSALTAWHVTRRLGWSGPSPADSATVGQIWQAGKKFAAPNLAGALLTAAAPAAVARFGGYDVSAAFSVLQRLFGTVQQAHAIALAPLWPAWAEAAGRGELPWVRHSLRLALVFTAALCAGLALVAAGLAPIIHLWLGAGAAVPGAVTAWLVATWISAAMFGQTLSYFLLGLGRLERVALPVAAAHICTLAAVGGLGSYFGGTGVVAALAAGATFGALPLFFRASVAAAQDLARKNSTPGATAVIL